MAWIEMHQSLLTHKKTLRLARLLKVNRFDAIGRLMALWSWAIDNAPDGQINKKDKDLIADVMEWKKVDQLLDALLSSGFLEETDFSFFIHDFEDYIGKLIDQRRATAERVRKHRAAKKAALSGAVTSYIPVTKQERNGHVASLPYPTVPNSTLLSLSPSNEVDQRVSDVEREILEKTDDEKDEKMEPDESYLVELEQAIIEAIDAKPETDDDFIVIRQVALSLAQIGTIRVTPDEIRRRAANLRARWERGVITPKSLKTNWSTGAVPPNVPATKANQSKYNGYDKEATDKALAAYGKRGNSYHG